MIPISLRAVAGQEYHCLPAGSSRFELPDSKAGNGKYARCLIWPSFDGVFAPADRSWRISGIAVPSSGPVG